MARVFGFASPENQAATGPVERFEALLRNPMYRPLLEHSETLPFRRDTLGPDTYSEFVVVVSRNTGKRGRR